MYNRYVPGKNGIYERHTVQEPKQETSCSEELQFKSDACSNKEEIAQQQSCPVRKTISGFDLGDLLLLCIVILLVIDSDEEDIFPLLIMAAAFLFQQ